MMLLKAPQKPAAYKLNVQVGVVYKLGKPKNWICFVTILFVGYFVSKLKCKFIDFFCKKNRIYVKTLNIIKKSIL